MRDRALHFAGTIRRRVADITAQLATCTRKKLKHFFSEPQQQENQLRAIHATLALDNNPLTPEQVQVLMDKERDDRTAPVCTRATREARSTIAAYKQLDSWQPYSFKDIQQAHRVLMHELMVSPGRLRTCQPGVRQGRDFVPVAPSAGSVQGHLEHLLARLEAGDEHPLVKACIFLHEFTQLQPFTDGNSRLGRLWFRRILCAWNPVLAGLPLEAMLLERKSAYTALLNRAESEEDTTAFVEFVLTVISDALHTVLASAAAPLSVRAKARVQARVQRVLDVLKKGEEGFSGLMTALGLKHRSSFSRNYLGPALSSCLIERTLPGHNPRQRYRLTAAGESLMAAAA